jgi:hypothetical protein
VNATSSHCCRVILQRCTIFPIYISLVERVSCLNPLYPLGLPPSGISIRAMEATAPYLERPPKRKRESSCSRSGPADESRGAKPMEPPSHNSTQVCESKLCTDPRAPYSSYFHSWHLPPTMRKRHQPRSPSDPWPVSWSDWTRRTPFWLPRRHAS